MNGRFDCRNSQRRLLDPNLVYQQGTQQKGWEEAPTAASPPVELYMEEFI